MENEILKINILSIAISGLLMLIAGILLYCFRDQLTSSIRYFLPIPPIGVAAYIFAFNFFKYHGADVTKGVMVREMFCATAVSSLFFFVFTAFLIGLIWLLKDL